MTDEIFAPVNDNGDWDDDFTYCDTADMFNPTYDTDWQE